MLSTRAHHLNEGVMKASAIIKANDAHTPKRLRGCDPKHPPECAGEMCGVSEASVMRGPGEGAICRETIEGRLNPKPKHVRAIGKPQLR